MQPLITQLQRLRGLVHRPSSAVTLREAFPFEAKVKYLIFDRDAKYGLEVLVTVRGMGIEPLRISWRSPWQNGVAERWVGSCRRELLDHVIPADERHLRRLLTDYVRYYHEDRTHLAMAKQTPNGRVRAETSGRVISCARLGGLHHLPPRGMTIDPFPLAHNSSDQQYLR